MILGSMELGSLSGHEAGRMLLRRLWEENIGQPMPEIAIADRGKPYFVDSPWHFSISHTKRRVFCVLHDAPVGLDAEEMDRDVNLRLAGKILSPGEQAQFHRAADPRLALLKFWVLKEASAKLSGLGLTGFPNHTDFSLEDPRVFETENCLVAILTD